MARRLWIRIPRSILGGCFFALYGIGSLLIGGLLFPPLVVLRARRAMRALVRMSWKLFVWGGRWTGLFRVAISSEDRARLAAARGCVVVANHITLIDVIVLGIHLPDLTAIVKAAAGSNFFYSLVVKGVFLVNDDPIRVMDEAKERLTEGVNLIVFPQGTRTPPTAPKRPLRRGAAQIALHAGAPILPVVISCDPPVLAKGQPWHDLAERTIVWTLKVGETIPAPLTQDTGTHAAAVALTEKIRMRLDL